MLNAFSEHLQDEVSGLGSSFADTVVDRETPAATALVAIIVSPRFQDRTRGAARGPGSGSNAQALLGNPAALAACVIAGAPILSTLGDTFVAGVTLIGLGIMTVSIALQGVFPSLTAGRSLLMERPITIGQRIAVQGVEGSVIAIDKRSTRLGTDLDGAATVPNSTGLGSIPTNRSTGFHPRIAVAASGLALTGRSRAVTCEVPASVAGTPPVRPCSRGMRHEPAPGSSSLANQLAHVPEADPSHEIAEGLQPRSPEAPMANKRDTA